MRKIVGNKVYSLGKFSLYYKVECYLSNFISTQMFKRKWREISGVFNLWEQLFMSFKSRESLWPFLVVVKVMIQTAGSWNWHSNKLPDNGLFELSSACFANAFHIAVYFFCLFRPDNDVNWPNLCAGQLHSTMTRLSPSIIFVKLIMQIFSATSNNRPFFRVCFLMQTKWRHFVYECRPRGNTLGKRSTENQSSRRCAYMLWERIQGNSVENIAFTS